MWCSLDYDGGYIAACTDAGMVAGATAFTDSVVVTGTAAFADGIAVVAVASASTVVGLVIVWCTHQINGSVDSSRRTFLVWHK